MRGERERGDGPAGLVEEGATIVVHMTAPLDAGDVQRVCAALRSLLPADRARDVLCHVHGAPDVSVIGALARLRQLGRRLEVPVRLRSAGPALEELLELTGLHDAVPERSEARRQPEPGEQRGVEEVMHVRDAPG